MFQNLRDNLYGKHVDFRELLYRSQQTCSDLNMGDGGAVPSVWRDTDSSWSRCSRWQNCERGEANFGSSCWGLQISAKTLRGRWFSRDSRRCEVFGPAPVQVQLLMLEFLLPDAEEDECMISACRRNDSASVEQFLQGPRNPNIGGNGPKLSKTIYTPNVRWAYHTRGFSVLACEAQNARVKWPTFEVKM